MQPPEPGRSFGRYVVDAEIGRTRTGVVYAATDTHLNRTIALEVVSGPLAHDAGFRERFEAEGAALARLDSPHVVTVFDHGEQDGLPFRASQYVRGGDLGRLLGERGPMPPTQAVQLCAQVAEGLADAHRAGVLHRDVNPRAVLLRDPDAVRLHAYLSDFGGVTQARDVVADTSEGPLDGLGGGAVSEAPERTAGGAATPASDVYALGCLLWVCLTGQPVYPGTASAMAEGHAAGPLRALAGSDPLSAHLNQVLATCLAKDPALRYRSAADAHRALSLAPEATVALVSVPLPGEAPAGAGPAPAPVAPVVMVPAAPGRPVPDPAVSAAHRAPTQSPGGGRRGADGAAPRRRVRLIVAAAVAVVVVVGGGVVAALATGGEDDPGGGADPTSEPTTARPTTVVSGYPERPPEREGPQAVTGDLDGDGLGDAYAFGQLGIEQTVQRTTYTSDGETFSAETEQDAYSEPMLGDWSGTGELGAVDLSLDDARRVVLGSSDGSVDPATYGVVDVEPAFDFIVTAAGDVDGDGLPDLVLWAQTGKARITVWTMHNDGGSFAEPATAAVFGKSHVYTSGFLVADFDRDGMSDLLVVETVTPPYIGDRTSGPASVDGPRQLRLLSSDGTGFVQSSGPFRNQILTDGTVLVGDYRGDGVPLLAFQDTSSASAAPISVYELGPDGLVEVPGFRAQVPVGIPRPRGTASDVDGDGDDDLVISEREEPGTYGKVLVLLSDRTSFQAVVSWGPSPGCAGAGDDESCFVSFAKTYR